MKLSPPEVSTIASLLTMGGITLSAQSLTSPPAPAPASPPGTTPPVSQPYPGLINTWLRQQAPEFEHWDLGVQERFRFESKNYFAANGSGPLAVDFNAATPVPHNNYTLFRTRVWVGYSPTEWISGYVQAQSSLQQNWGGDPPPGANGPIGLYQYWATLGNPKEFPVTLKAGRQELVYGDERLIGNANWENVGRVFDAAKLRYTHGQFWVDAFASSVVLPVNQGTDIVNWDEVFWGLYAQTKGLIPKGTAEFYFLGDNANTDSQNNVGTVQRGNSPRDIYTLGTHLKSVPGALNGWDYDVELAGQLGQFQYPRGTPVVVNGKKLDQTSYAMHFEGGYTLTNAWAKPRFGLIFNQASGDDDPLDEKHETFVNLFPTNHKFYGAMDFFSWQNMREIAATSTWYPVGKLKATLNFHVFWLQTTEDFSYNATQAARTTGGYGIRPNNSSGFGQELDLILSYPIRKFGAIEGGFGHFFTGDYVDESLANTGGTHDANWCYVQLNLAF
ncbi:MAG TPA: alginate export family protein [Verrucomicrobiota bacterium]|nr:alginate export family protein [Verrucomicrobiota bacterium]